MLADVPRYSRSDAGLGDDFSFNPVFFAEAASYFQKPMIDVNDAAKARLARMTTMKKLNPTFSISDAATMNSFIEQSFYLSVFGDPYTGVARSDWVQSWFGRSNTHGYHVVPFGQG